MKCQDTYLTRVLQASCLLDLAIRFSYVHLFTMEHLQVTARGITFLLLALLLAVLIGNGLELTTQQQGWVSVGCLVSGWLGFRAWYRNYSQRRGKAGN